MEENKRQGLLLIVSGPSGAGKGTVVSRLLEKRPDCILSVSCTTRQPRVGEVDGVNYHFLSVEEFEKKIANDEFVEHTEYCGNFYGTLKSETDCQLEKGKDVILEIEVDGASQMMKLRPDAIFIFIAPPSIAELERRLHKRGTEKEEVIKERVAKAEKELSFAPKYDYIVVNDELEDAVDDFKAIIRAEKCRTKNK